VGNKYVDLDSSNGDGSTWGNAFNNITLSNPVAGLLFDLDVGDDVWIQGLTEAEFGEYLTIKLATFNTASITRIIGVKDGTTNAPPESTDLIPGLMTGSSTPAYDQSGANIAPKMKGSSGGWSFKLGLGNFYFYGIKLQANYANGELWSTYTDRCLHTYEECELSWHNAVAINSASDTSYGKIIFKNCSHILNNNTTYFDGHSGDVLFVGGKITKATTNTTDGIFQRNGDVALNNVDLSDITDIFGGTLEFGAKTISRCKVNSSFNLFSATGTIFSGEIDAWSIDNGSGCHYFEYIRREGKVLESEAVYRTDGDIYDKDISTTHFSAEYQPNSNVVLFTNPLSPRPIKTLKLDLSAAVTLRFFILQQDASAIPDKLTHGNVQLRAVHPDTTDTALGVTVNTGEEEATPVTVLNAGSADNLDDSTEAWTGSSGNVVRQQIEITIPQNTQTGMDKAVVEFWLDVSVDLDTPSTELFIDTLPDDIS